MTLGVVPVLAVRPVQILRWPKADVLAAEVAVGVAVVGLELLAHG